MRDYRTHLDDLDRALADPSSAPGDAQRARARVREALLALTRIEELTAKLEKSVVWNGKPSLVDRAYASMVRALLPKRMSGEGESGAGSGNKSASPGVPQSETASAARESSSGGETR